MGCWFHTSLVLHSELSANVGTQTWAQYKLPGAAGWVVQDLPSRWYENAEIEESFTMVRGNTGISVLFEVFIV